MDIKQIISEWVLNNFGQSELDDPCYNIDELSKYITDRLGAIK